jgi:hypothetical protein
VEQGRVEGSRREEWVKVRWRVVACVVVAVLRRVMALRRVRRRVIVFFSFFAGGCLRGCLGGCSDLWWVGWLVVERLVRWMASFVLVMRCDAMVMGL